MKQKQNATVISQREIAPAIYDMWIETTLAKQAKPGQFLCIYTKDKSRLLPRPISICEVNEEKTALRIVYRVAGAGTEEFSHYHPGDTMEILGTLGNGFPWEEAEGKKVFLMGGSFLLESLSCKVCGQFELFAAFCNGFFYISHLMHLPS